MQQKEVFLYTEFYHSFSKTLGNVVWPIYLFKKKKERKKINKEIRYERERNNRK